MDRERTRRVVRAIGAIGLVVNAIYWSVELALWSRHPDGYAARHIGSRPWVYPTREVIECIGLIAMEAAGAAWLLAFRPTALRAIGLAAVYFGFLIAMVPFAMHASSAFVGHLVSLFCATIWLVFVSIVATGLAYRDRRPHPPALPRASVARRRD